MEELEEIRRRLRALKEGEIRSNEPHFTQRLALRGGRREEVIAHLLNPEQLVAFSAEPGKRGDPVYRLYFRMSSTRTLLLPVIFTGKGLYILTYIVRYRSWQRMVRHGKTD